MSTNVNGLISIRIGYGTVLSGDFTTIDWANGPYFIKTEIDPLGDTNYTIINTSQILSVPYVLHAKTTENVIGEINEADPLFTVWDKDYNDLNNTPAIDGSETKITAGTNIEVVGEGTTSSPYIINSSSVGSSTTHYVGYRCI
ncbi:hypothetical protein MASR2M117_18280 [Paludibacter sp.]